MFYKIAKSKDEPIFEETDNVVCVVKKKSTAEVAPTSPTQDPAINWSAGLDLGGSGGFGGGGGFGSSPLDMNWNADSLKNYHEDNMDEDPVIKPKMLKKHAVLYDLHQEWHIPGAISLLYIKPSDKTVYFLTTQYWLCGHNYT